ncbi:tricarboxylate carrier [Necator americanus]|uniref:Tricarboxylate carrier n=1 Tax=Necator americanus TaxID=51031 RepID=W2T2E6_NECAM|nr:tricarboxylate carrier [Necator americanus]ETN75391.1 tricarboxylate carrier [Necator americanus]
MVDSGRVANVPTGKGLYSKDLTVDQLWRAKQIYDSAYHPDTGEKMFILGRMSAQVPCNMTITGGMLTFYKKTAHVVFFQWINQTFNAIVNYTNRSGPNPITKERLLASYVCATGGAMGTALGANYMLSKMKVRPYRKLQLLLFRSFMLEKRQRLSKLALDHIFSSEDVRFGLKTLTSPIPLLSHVSKNSSSPVSYTVFSAWRLLVSGILIILLRSTPHWLALHLQVEVEVKNVPKIIAALVPFLAVAASNAINIPMMRSNEFVVGIPVEDEKGTVLGSSLNVPYYAIPQVTISRIGMAVPSMGKFGLYFILLNGPLEGLCWFSVFGPILFQPITRMRSYRVRIKSKSFFTCVFKGINCHICQTWMATPIQTLMAGFFLTFSTPLCCAIFPQKTSISVSRLEPAMQHQIKNMKIPPTVVYYNKGL